MIIPPEVLSDFRNHLYFCFKYLGLGNPTPKQYAMAELLQNGPSDFLLQAGRGDGKSVINACFVSWCLLLDPNKTQLILSATGDRAIKFVSQVRQTLSLVPYMIHLQPQEFEKDSAFGFNVHGKTKIGQDLSVSAKGITSQITGSHADCILCDDIEIPENSDTPSSREKLWERCMELENVRNKVEGGSIRFLGTPQTKDSVYNRLLNIYPVFRFPAVMPDITIPSECENVSEYILKLQLEPGMSTQPERFSEEVMCSIEAKIGPSLFALHYKLDTSNSDSKKFPLHLSDLIVFDVDNKYFPNKVVWSNANQNKRVPVFGMRGDLVYEPMWASTEYIPFLETVMFIDPSGRGTDETAICVGSFANGYIIIHELFGMVGGYDNETLLKICKTVNAYNVKKIRFESNYGDGMFGQILRPIVSNNCGQVALEEYKVSGNKEQRLISTLEPVFAQHRLVFDTRCIRDKETQIQITRLTDKRGCLAKDDRVDVLAAAVSYWAKGMSIDPDVQIKNNKARKDLENHLAWLGNKRSLHLLGPLVSGACRTEAIFPIEDPRKQKKRGYGISVLNKNRYRK